MTGKFRKKFISATLISLFIFGSICANIAESKPWNNDYTWHEETWIRSNEGLPNGDEKISLSLRDTDVKQVLRMFADKAGLNIIFVGDVNGSITMDLVNTELNTAFNLILETAKLTYIIDNGTTLIVMSLETAKSSSFNKQSMRVIPIKYVDAASVASFLNKNVFGLGKPGISSGNVVVTNQARNEIMIFGTNADYEMAKQVIPKIDIKPQSTTYKINHVTPKEMASLICDSLFTKSSDAGTTKLAGVLTGAAENISVGAGTIACKVSGKVSGGNLESFSSIPMTVMYNEGLGTINLLGGSAEQIQLVNEFILLHDKKQPQAVLEFAVLELNEEGSHLFQNEWTFLNNTFPVSFKGGTLTLGSIIFFGADTPGTSGLNRGGMPALWDTITWMEKTGKGKLIQKPSIIATNGNQSTIDLTQDYVEKTDSQVSTSTFSQTPVVTRTYTIGKEQGMKIGITPFISTDGYVTMNLEVDYATPYHTETGTDQLGNNYTAATLLERRNLKLNTVRVKNGETLVLGGLIYEKETQNIDKIPLLGDIPGLGVFFRNTANTKHKTELVIMITPRIIDDTEDTLDI